MICPKCGETYVLTIKVEGKLHKVKAKCGCGTFKVEWTEAR